MRELERLAESLGRYCRTRTEAHVEVAGHKLPLYSFALGPEDPSLPTLMITGGVHGLERIGTVIAMSYLATVAELLTWDRAFCEMLESCRIVMIPMVNPGGMWAHTRCNPKGVDLMRNAAIDAESEPRLGLVGGHRLSPRLPWYRGRKGDAMELEAETLCAVVRRELFAARCAVAIDLHSGFGLIDRIWFPYAYTKRPFTKLPEVMSLKARLDKALPNHPYQVEPQSLRYITHGDLWDYLLVEHARTGKSGLFLPFCLEMGSWLWVKKNPRQMLSPTGLFNPILPHRLQRTVRRHVSLLDFMLRATYSYANWSIMGEMEREQLRRRAMNLWYT
jgi:hypothetical protein